MKWHLNTANELESIHRSNQTITHKQQKNHLNMQSNILD